MESIKKFSLVIPVFNEEETLEYSFDRLQKTFAMPFFQAYEKIEIIMVNNGSRDRSGEMLRSFEKSTRGQKVEVRVVHLSRNFGHSGGVCAGLFEVQGGEAAIADADLQDPPELLPEMIAKLRTGYDVVYGQRVVREGEGWFKRSTAWAFYRVLNLLTGVEIPKDTGDFRVMTKEVVDAVCSCREQEPFLRGLIAWLGFRQAAFPYTREPRRFGATKYPLWQLIRFAGKAILSFSTKPLYVGIYLSVLVFFLCVLLIVWATYEWFVGNVVPGWTSLLVVFLVAQAMIFAVLGLFGLYIAQILKGVQGRPRFVKRHGARTYPETF